MTSLNMYVSSTYSEFLGVLITSAPSFLVLVCLIDVVRRGDVSSAGVCFYTFSHEKR